METSHSLIFKIVLIGSSAVGKTSIVKRLVQGTFTLDLATTIGAGFYQFTYPISASENVKLQIWDSGGHERFRSITKQYFRNAVGAVLIYDITDRNSFDQLTDWLNDFQSLCAPNAYILLVGNKADLEQNRTVGPSAVKEFADRHKLESIETSALSGKNVKEAFTRLAIEIVSRMNSGLISVGNSPKTVPTSSFKSESVEGTPKGCC